MGGRIRSSVLEIFSLRCLLDIEVEISSRQLDIKICSSEGKSWLNVKKWNNIIKKLSIDSEEKKFKHWTLDTSGQGKEGKLVKETDGANNEIIRKLRECEEVA